MSAPTEGLVRVGDSDASDGFVRAGDLGAADLAPGELRAVTLDSGERLCVGNHAGELFAVHDVCTHAEFPLSEGALYANGELECCFHGAKFDCRSGEVLRGPAEEPVATWEVRVMDGTVWVRPGNTTVDGERKRA